MRYGELIKERRTVLGLTQQDLADYTEPIIENFGKDCTGSWLGVDYES